MAKKKDRYVVGLDIGTHPPPAGGASSPPIAGFTPATAEGADEPRRGRSVSAMSSRR